MIKLYSDIKAKYPDSIILFRENDNYVSINADAHVVANVLGTVVFHNGFAKTEFRIPALDVNLTRLIKAGLKIAICDTIEEPTAKKRITNIKFK